MVLKLVKNKSANFLNFDLLHSWPPKETRNNGFLNFGPKSVFLAFKPKTSLASSVEQLAFILKKEIAKTIIKVGLEKEQIIAALQNTEIAKRVINITNNLII